MLPPPVVYRRVPTVPPKARLKAPIPEYSLKMVLLATFAGADAMENAAAESAKVAFSILKLPLGPW
jgi:hypothetical protein